EGDDRPPRPPPAGDGRPRARRPGQHRRPGQAPPRREGAGGGGAARHYASEAVAPERGDALTLPRLRRGSLPLPQGERGSGDSALLSPLPLAGEGGARP